MNSRILNKVVLQSLRHSHCRYLSVQHNVNKCSSTCNHAINFHRKRENRSSSFIFTKFSNDRTLCQSTLPIYTCFQRNLSGTSQLSQAANVEQLTKATNVAPPIEDIASPIGDIAQTVPYTSIFNPEVMESIFVQHFQEILLQMHEATGLPMWASIALTAFFIRTTIILPFSITQLRLMAKLEKVKLTMKELDKKLKRETIKSQKELGWPNILTQQKYEEVKNITWMKLSNKENYNPMKTYFLFSIQTATWITSTVAISTLCDAKLAGADIAQKFTTGGFGWITDLTQLDPLLVLPISIVLMNLCIVETHHAFKVLRRSKTEQWKFAFYRVISIGVLPLAGYMPAAVNIYWLSSSSFGLLQAFILNSASMRRLFRVPMNDPQLEKPYRFFLKNMKEKLKIVKGETAITAK